MQQILSGIQVIKPGHHLPPLPPPCPCPFPTLPDPRICWTRQIYCLQLKNPPTGLVHCNPLCMPLRIITERHSTAGRTQSIEPVTTKKSNSRRNRSRPSISPCSPLNSCKMSRHSQN
jgi:hypothetical protein